MSLLNDILRNAVAAKASDVHINVGLPPMFRVHTIMKASDFPIVTPEGALRLLKEMVNDKRIADFERDRDSDFSYEIPGIGRFRVNAHYQRNTIALAFRIINDKVRPIEELFLPELVNKLTYLPRGLILVTGGTGSGKSTTLAAMIDSMNKREYCHIITLEDPIEYTFVSNKCTIEQREVGADVTTFGSGLRHVLRQDPDTILVGEMRDLETTSAAITAAETGHLVFGTLHTTGAARTVDRIIDQYPREQQEQIRSQLAQSLVAVISQILMPAAGGGRVAAFEIMLSNPAIENHIRKCETFKIPSVIQTSRRQGMVLMDDFLLDLWRAGRITKEMALERGFDRKAMAVRMGGGAAE